MFRFTHYAKLLSTIASIFVFYGCSTYDDNSNVSQLNQSSTQFTTYTAEQFYQTRSVFGSSINADATAVLVSDDVTGIFNAYKVPIDGSQPTQLTRSSEESIYVVDWFPNDERFLYRADIGGNELNHLYVQEIGGKVQDLTPGENFTARFMGWDQNNQQFYVATNERDNKFFDLYVYQISDYSRQLLYQNNSGLSPQVISPNGQYLALSKVNSNADSNLYLVDMFAKNIEAELFTEHQGDIEYNAYTFTRDNKALIYSTDEMGEFSQVWSYDINSKKKSVNVSADWDVSFSYFSKDGRYQVNGVNADAQTQIDIRDLKTNTRLSLPSLPSGDLRGVNFSADSKQMVFYINSDTSPSNLYVHQLGSNKVKRLTDTGNPAILEANLVVGKVVRFKSFDGLDIPGDRKSVV